MTASVTGSGSPLNGVELTLFSTSFLLLVNPQAAWLDGGILAAVLDT